MYIVDITHIFYDLVQNILHLDYEELVKTPSMQELSLYIHDKNGFMVQFDEMIYFEDVDDLFYGSLEYFKKNNKKMEEEWMIQAIKKMEKFVVNENMDEMMNLFGIL